MRVRRVSVFKGAAIAGLLLLGLSFTPNAAARMRCSYTGPPENVLAVTADMDALGQITRRGQEIVVREFLGRASPCRGGVPTVLNTDTIRVSSRGKDDSVDVLLGGGPLAPGATPETEGASEIEIEIEFRAAASLAGVVGTRRADEFHWGPGFAHHPGLNLNPRESGDQDVDVTVRGRYVFLIAAGAAGSDTIAPAPGGPFPNDGVFSIGGPGDDRLIAPRNSGGILEGGPGDDVLIGGSRDLLYGGGGNDRLAAGDGRDQLIGGPGRDLLSGGRGRDHINAQDPKRETKRERVKCGRGRDFVRADRQDRLRGCELVRRR
jgi:hypothetical protein